MAGRKRQVQQELPGSPLGGPDEENAELDAFNNPDMTDLGETPPIGSRSAASSMFGSTAETSGRPTSPKLYAQQAHFPTAVQHRVWRWENGVPVAIGAIDAEATEEDFINQFFDAMPRKGDGRFQYRLRPIDIRGQELGKEFSITISEHHEMLRRIRDRKLRDMEEEREMNGGRGRDGTVIVNSGDQQAASAAYAEEMGRMFEHTVQSAEQRTDLLQQQLEMERERMRQEEKERVSERVRLAETSTSTVQSMTERLMEADRRRAAEALEAERLRAKESISGSKEQSSLLLNTLTSVFQQQQEAARSHAERQREADKAKAEQDREFFDRQRRETEDRRKAELEMMRLEVQKREERERIESDREKMRLAEEREKLKQELEEKRRADQLEWERRTAAEREDRERRDRAERERWEKEKMEWERREVLRREEAQREAQARKEQLDREKLEYERKESLRREEMSRELQLRQEALSREEARRSAEILLQQKAMETAAQRDREHAERMMEMAKLEREAQREATLQREKSERESREARDRAEASARETAEKERQRQYELQMKEMTLQKERDREHAERMIQLQKSSQPMGGLTDLLGMETPELLERIFGGVGGAAPEGGWADAIPKVLGGIGEVVTKVLAAKQAETRVMGRRQIPVGMGPPALPPPPQPQQANPGFQTSNEASPPAPPVQPKPTTSTPVPKSPENEKVDTFALAKAAGLSMLVQKKARKAIRNLVEMLERAPAEQWEGLVMSAMVGEPSGFEYIKAVGLPAALVEAKASEELTKKVMALVEERMNGGEAPAEETPATEPVSETPSAPVDGAVPQKETPDAN
jgi:hypothetical protein